MTQEDKELLLKDLCARLPYGVKVNITSKESKNRIVHLTADNICNLTSGWWSECKPYLLPLSSMTEEQRKELDDTLLDLNLKALSDEVSSEVIATYEIDFYNKKHFDYRGLISKGLAIDVTGKNIY